MYQNIKKAKCNIWNKRQTLLNLIKSCIIYKNYKYFASLPDKITFKKNTLKVK